MATQVQFRRGTTTQNNAFTGAIGEITYDTEAKTLRLHDGSTAGGGATVVTLTGTQTLTNKTLSTSSVWNGNVVGLAYGGTAANLSATAGGVVYSGASAMAISSAGTSGQVLTSAGSSAPTWTSQSSLSVGTATTATTATNISGGSAGYIMYQVDTNETGFIAPGSNGYILRSTGASTAPDWIDPGFTIGSTSMTLGNTYTAIDGISTFYITGTTDASSSTTGVLRVAGGISTQKKLYVGTDLNVGGNTVITGNLTVNGTTTTVNSTTVTIDDKNIELGSVDTPTDTTANGGGITLKGDTDKTIIWDSSNSNWTSSEHWNIASGKSFKIATVPVLTATTVLNDSSQTSIGIGGYATTVSIGASTGATTINNELDVTGNTVLTGDLQVKGGDFTVDSASTTFNLVNTNATTLNIGGAATAHLVALSDDLHALQPVQVVFGPVRQDRLHPRRMDQRGSARVQRPQPAARHGRVTGRLTDARAEDPALVPDEAQAVRELVRDNHAHVARVGELDAIGPVHVPDLVGRELRASLDAAGPAELAIERPVQDVVVVRAPAGDHPEAVGVVPQPARPVVSVFRMHPLLAVRLFRGAAQPAAEVEVGRDRLDRGIRGGGIDRQPDLDPPEAADAAAADEFARPAELPVITPLLAAELEDPAMPLDRPAQDHALRVRHRHRLLQIGRAHV